MLEETGYRTKALSGYLDIEELFDVWRHINHYFICELIEDKDTLAFMDIAKDVDGHILVIPKKHCKLM